MFKDMFTLSGRWNRLNRLRYFGYGVLANVVFMLIVFALMAVVVGGASSGSDLGALGGAMLAVIPVYLALFWIAICLMTKRLHDLNQSGWWVLGLFGYSFGSGFISGMVEAEPLLSLVLAFPTFAFGLWLLFWPGTAGDNQFGPDPLEQA